MTEYRFYIRNGELACEFTRGSVTYFLDQDTAKKKLYNLSFDEYDDVKPSNNCICFVKKNLRLVFDEFGKLFFKFGPYGGYNYVKKLAKAYSDYQIKRIGKKAKKVSKKGIVKAVCTAGVATMLLANKNLYALGALTSDTAEIIDIDDALIDESELVPTTQSPVETYLNELDKDVTAIITGEKEISYKHELFDTCTIDFECDEKGYSNDVEFVKEKYGAYLEEASTTYGVSLGLLIALLTHESHGKVEDNLMQIIFNSHKDEIKQTYNFVTGQYESFVITNNPEAYKDKGCKIYTEEDLKDPYTNIMCGTSILTFYYHKKSGSNIFLALICYNKGPGTLNKIMKDTTETYGVSAEDMLYNPIELSFLPIVHITRVGDPLYLEHVLQYNPAEDPIYILMPPDSQISNNIIYINKKYVKVI